MAEQFGPAIAVEPYQGTSHQGSVVAFTWHDARAQPFVSNNPTTTVWSGFYWPTPNVMQLTGQLSVVSDGPTGQGVPWLQNAPSAGNTGWGDYEGLVADPYVGAFYGAWGDNRDQTTNVAVQVYGASLVAP